VKLTVRTPGRSLVCVLIATLALTACGSSGSKSSGGSKSQTQAPGSPIAAASGAPAPAGKGAAFNLGTICSCSGAQSAVLAQLGNVSTAWARSINAGGGINGHPVKLTVLDDSGNPATALQDAKQLVETDHIQALVGDDSLADQSYQKYVDGAGVPVVGGLAPSIPFLTDPNFFATGATLPVMTVGLGALAKAAGAKKLGVMYCSETPLCAEVIPIAKGAAQLSGLAFASLAISATSPSYAAPCLNFKNQGVDALFVADNAAVVQRVVAACAQQGYKPAIVDEATTGDAQWLQDPNLNGVLLSSSNPGFTDGTNPGVAAFTAALKKYAPGVLTSTAFSYDTLYPWIAGELFATAAKTGGLTPSSTSAQVKAALDRIKGQTLGGLAPPLTVTPGKPVFVPCYYGVTIKSGAYADLQGGKPMCLTTTQSTALEAALKKLI
jgi:branched-chain amino acid transport system substrate-binding protein